MARVILCETKPATTSYIFPNTRIEVFSYEELCYYIYNNAALLSAEHIGVPMIHWIRDELKLPELSESLRQLKEKEGTDLTDLATTILTFREYYSIPEVKEFILKLERMKNLSVPEFRKLQADGFLRYHKYLKALSVYDEILEQIEKQLAKLVEVISIKHFHTAESCRREMALIKVKAKGTDRAVIIETCDIFRAHIVDVSQESVIVEATGSEDKIASLIRLLEPYGIIELAKTGLTAMQRGSDILQ